MPRKTKTLRLPLAKPNGDPNELFRTNFFITKGSFRNLEVLAACKHCSVALLVREAIDAYLKERGYDPSNFPTGVTVKY